MTEERRVLSMEKKDCGCAMVEIEGIREKQYLPCFACSLEHAGQMLRHMANIVRENKQNIAPKLPTQQGGEVSTTLGRPIVHATGVVRNPDGSIPPLRVVE